MPPQAALNDLQVSQVANYVRANWGNHGDPITEKFVASVRAQKHDDIWHTWQLTKAYRLQNKPVKIQHLISERLDYTDDLSKVATMKAKAVEEENSGYIEPKQAGDAKEAFSGRWTGSLQIKKPGKYFFSLDVDHQAELVVNGKTHFKIPADSPAKGKWVKLPKGKAKIELRYTHQKATTPKLLFYWSGPGFVMRPLHVSSKTIKAPPIKLKPSPERALVHRNFLNKKGSRTVAVGYHEGVNFIFSVERLSLESIWQGEFLEVGKTWTGRARGQIATPLNKSPQSLPGGFSAIKDKESVEKKFLGYEFDIKGYPTLNYLVDGATVRDHYAPSPDGKSLTRTITQEGSSNLTLRLSDTKPTEGNTVKLSNGFTIQSSVKSQSSDALDINITNKPVTIHYTWK